MHIPSIAITTSLIGSGVLAWTLATHSLVENPDLDVPLNPLGINRSPYGEVFAMAMQSPIDSYFHAGMGEANHQHAPGESCSDQCSEPVKKHEHDENCEHDHENHDYNAALVKAKKTPSLDARLLNLITSLNKASELRTNPKAANEALKRHLRREAENKLRFAYQLDPSHYANYNSLHFFLTEPQIGTRPQLTASAAKLSEETIDYCLKQENDPRPALTAAAACTNILHLMFTDRSNESPKFTTAQMRQCLGLLDHCLTRYTTIATQWDESKNWELLSPMRITECEERFHFISKIREDVDKTILRYETQPTS
jgi:hypothetical protein